MDSVTYNETKNAATTQAEDWAESQFLFNHGQQLCDIADAFKNPAFGEVSVDVMIVIAGQIAADLFSDLNEIEWAVDKICLEMGALS